MGTKQSIHEKKKPLAHKLNFIVSKFSTSKQSMNNILFLFLFLFSPKPGESLSSYFIWECLDTKPSSSTMSSWLGTRRPGGGGCGGGAWPLVLETELLGTPSESLRFFTTWSLGGGSGGTLSRWATPLAGVAARARPASRSTLVSGSLGLGWGWRLIWPESLALASPENLGLKPVFLAQEEGGIAFASGNGAAGGHGPGCCGALGSESAIASST